MRLRHRALAAIPIALLTAIGGPARAQNGASADALFREAKASIARGEIDRACAMFAESNRLEPAVGTLLNLADCEERRHRIAQASQLFVRAKEAMPPGDDRLPYVEDRLAKLAPRIPHVTLRRANGAPRELRLSAEGTTYSDAVLGVPLPLEPGVHLLRVEAIGYVGADYTITVAEGESAVLEIAPGRRVGDGAAAVHPNDSKSFDQQRQKTESSPQRPVNPSTARTAGWVFMGSGLVGIATGTITGILVFANANTYKAHCTPVCDDEGAQAARVGRPLSVISPIALGIGVLGVGVGAFLVVTSKSATSKSARGTARVGIAANGIALACDF
ncbi:MAG: hypothetical protein NVS3B20_13790 [Polyangiales bacterium]